MVCCSLRPTVDQACRQLRSLPDVQSGLVRSEETPSRQPGRPAPGHRAQQDGVRCRGLHRPSSPCLRIDLLPILATNLLGRRLDSNTAGMARMTMKARFILWLHSVCVGLENKGLLGENLSLMPVMGGVHGRRAARVRLSALGWPNCQACAVS